MGRRKNTPEQAAAAKVRRAEYMKAYNKADKEARSAAPAYKEAKKAYNKVYREDPVHKETQKAYNKVYREDPVHKETHKATYKAWSATPKGNAIKNNAHAKRSAAKKQRTVSWGCDKTIKEIYLAAAQTTAELGIQMHVDHIVPLQGIILDNCQTFMREQWSALELPGAPHNVSGLHWQLNLQLLSQFDNTSKGNRITQAEALGLPPQ